MRASGPSEPKGRTGAEVLRIIVANLDATSETFNDGFTLEGLVQIGRVLLACEFDVSPDCWTPRQIREALKGIKPRWNDDDSPRYS